jgi:FlaA1/EpsC-like NDP-sugar epimerase
MRPLLTRASQVVIDLTVLAVAYALAYVLRLEGWPQLWMLKRLVITWPYVVVFQYLVLSALNVPRFAWIYVGLREVRRIVAALGISAAVLFVVRFAAGQFLSTNAVFSYAYVAGGIIVIDFALAVLGVSGVRVVRRILAERNPGATAVRRTVAQQPTLLIGAGEAGVSIAREIGKHPELGIDPVGFLDDDRIKVGTEIQGLAVLGTTAQIPRSPTRRSPSRRSSRSRTLQEKRSGASGSSASTRGCP